MNLAEIIEEVAIVAPGNNMEKRLKSFVNRAQRAICSRYDFTFLHDRIPVTMDAGATSVSLPIGFKRLTTEQSPISYTFGAYDIPVFVVSREQTEIWYPWLCNVNQTAFPPIPFPVQCVFMEQDGPGNSWTINIPGQIASPQALTFNVSAYWYPEDLDRGTDTSAVTNDGLLCEALLSKAKSLAYAATNPSDPNMTACLALYEQHLKSAMYTDAAIMFQGRCARM